MEYKGYDFVFDTEKHGVRVNAIKDQEMQNWLIMTFLLDGDLLPLAKNRDMAEQFKEIIDCYLLLNK